MHSEYSNQPLLCEELEEVKLEPSDACDPLDQNNMKWGEVQNLELTLAPRSSCGFFLYSYNGYLDIYF